MSQEPVPVFVFLDENISRMDEKILDFFAKNYAEALSRFDLFILPFPRKYKGKPDHEVVYMVRDYIFSNDHIQNCLSSSPDVQFLFLTLDKNFIDDVAAGLRNSSLRKRKAPRLDRKIIPAGNFIMLVKKDSPVVCLLIIPICHSQNAGKETLVADISKSLKDFLNANF